MNHISRRGLLQASLALALPAWAQTRSWASGTFPSHALKIVQPMPAGSAADAVSRLMATAMEPGLRQPLMVENKPGGAFKVAMNTVAAGPADGHTLIFINSGMLATQAVYGQFDFFKELTPIVASGETDICMIASAKLPVRSMKELIEYARANAGRFSYATPGPGTLEHLALAAFCKRYGIDAIHVPVKGGPDMLKMVLQGDVDMSTLAVPLVQPFVGTDRLRALVLLSEQRNAAVPDVPTYVEEKLDVSRLTIWGGVAVPKGTPKEAVEVLERVALAAVTTPEFQKKLKDTGMNPRPLSSADFGKLWQSDFAWISKSATGLKDTLTR